MLKQAILRTHRALVAILLASSVVFSGAQSAFPQSSENAGKPAPASAKAAGSAQLATPAQAAPAQPSAPTGRPAPVWQGSQLNRLSGRAEMYYQGVWGVGELRVKAAESGELIRFTYRVFDSNKAAALNDKKLNPVLESPEKGLRLVVPSMEKVGQLRQAPQHIEAGKFYWMAFSNSGRRVKPGDRVDIVIGNFHARGLMVE